MVSTRPQTSHCRSKAAFEKGEKVLCYEPDKTKAQVLYDSKILSVYESKDRRGRKIVQYKIHFQGWSSSWDRKVNSDFVLKDTPENRLLQRELAEKAKLQLGTYLYRKERKSKKRSRRLYLSLGSNLQKNDIVEDFVEFANSSGANIINNNNSNNSSSYNEPINVNSNCYSLATIDQHPACVSATLARKSEHNYTDRLRPRGFSEDNFSSGSTIERSDEFPMKERGEIESDSYCSSVESFYDEDRVVFRIGERLRQNLEYDGEMVRNYGRRHALPADLPALTVLENFVKWSAVKMVLTTIATQAEPSRRRSTLMRATDKKEREFEKIVATVTQLKEVADGLRIYFDFTLSDYLLYKEERDTALPYLNDDYLDKFIYTVKPIWLAAESSASTETATLTCTSALPRPVEKSKEKSEELLCPLQREETQKRKLRSHNRSEESDAGSGTTGGSVNSLAPLDANILGAIKKIDTNLLRSVNTNVLNLPLQFRDYLQSILSWHLLPNNAMPAPSMIFGAVYLARLLIKLPEFLNATSMSDDKLRTLLQHLESFANYLESRNDLFAASNYIEDARATAAMYAKIPTSPATLSITVHSAVTGITPTSTVSVCPSTVSLATATIDTSELCKS